jgi:hypothetical protein
LVAWPVTADRAVCCGAAHPSQRLECTLSLLAFIACSGCVGSAHLALDLDPEADAGVLFEGRGEVYALRDWVNGRQRLLEEPLPQYHVVFDVIDELHVNDDDAHADDEGALQLSGAAVSWVAGPADADLHVLV